jgi:hypothetical protein
MGNAWNNWFHCTGSTYGTWLRGDPRGWRARHHCEHVDGDYRNPPPQGTHDDLHAKSQRLLKRERVVLSAPLREMACRLIGKSLQSDGVELIDLCVGSKHWHVLARFRPIDSARDPKREPRVLIGRAKGRSAHEMSKAGLVTPGGVWAVRCKCMPVRDRAHQVNVARYIREHVRQGAAVWSMLPENRKDKPRN